MTGARAPATLPRRHGPGVRKVLKSLARGLATLAVSPLLLSYVIRGAALGKNRALEGSTQTLSLIPGVLGDYLRGAFLTQVLAKCDPSVTVQFGTIFSQAGARLGANVYIGPRCHLGLVDIGRDVLLAAGVHVPSGSATHGMSAVDVPIRDQPGTPVMVHIGEGTWVASAAVVLADVGKHSVVGAGAVVTTPIPDYVIAVGVPARVVRERKPAVRGA